MSAYMLEGQSPAGWELTDKERRVLWDAVPEPSSPRVDDKGRATLTERTKIVFTAARRLFGPHCEVDFGSRYYEGFRQGISLRDRLMHPKRASDLVVEPADLGAVDQTRDWFRFAAKRFFEAAAEELRARMTRS